MKRPSNDVSNIITASSTFKLPIWFAAGAMASFALFLYAQIELQRHEFDAKLADTNTSIDRKTGDRLTRTEARQYQESIKQRFDDFEKRNETTHTAFQRELDRNARDIASIKKE